MRKKYFEIFKFADKPITEKKQGGVLGGGGSLPPKYAWGVWGAAAPPNRTEHGLPSSTSWIFVENHRLFEEETLSKASA